MGQSLVKNYLHIIFSTKHRQPFIIDSIATELFSYIGGICNRMGCQTVIVGGYRDHIHILCLLSKKITLMKLMEEVKGHSSKWIKTKGEGFKLFYWQNARLRQRFGGQGYGAFSVKSKDIDQVTKYIQNQRAHHSGQDFQTEYRLFLEENEMEFDEKYLWD